MTLTSSAMLLGASKLAQTGLALVASVILARGIGPSGLGLYAALISFAVLLQGLTSCGFEDLVLARGPAAGGDTANARSLYRRTLRVRGFAAVLLAAGAAAAFAGLVPDPFGDGDVVAFGCAVLYAALNSVATLGAAIQAARVRPANSAVLDAVWWVGVTATYAVLLVSHDLTLRGAFLTMVIWQAGVLIGYSLFLFPIALAPGSGEESAPLRMSGMIGFWINGLLSLGVGKNSDVLAMNAAGAPAASVGRYSAAYNANLTAAQILVQGTGTMMYVGLGQVFADGSPSRLADAWRRATVAAGLLSVPLLVYCVFFPRAVLTTIYGDAYTPAAATLVVLAGVGVLARMFGGGANQSLLFLAHRQNQVLLVRGVFVALNVGLDVVLYRALGIVGVALASGGCGLAITYVEFLLSRRFTPVQVPWAPFVRMVLPFVVTGMLARSLFGDNGDVLSLVASPFVVLLAGAVLLKLTKPLQTSDLPDSAPAVARRLLRHITVAPPSH